jgi:DNA-binding IclR family transcriptional regulator
MENTFQVPNLVRGLKVIEHLVEQQSEMSSSEIAKTLGFPANSSMRILNALEHYGYVERNSESKTYRLSRKLFSMAYSMPKEKTLIESSLPMMKELRDEYGETVVLSVMEKGFGLILEQVQGTYPFRFVCEPGARQHLHSSASTKAILAHLSKDHLQETLKGHSYTSFTNKTLKSKNSFIADIENSRKNGYFLDLGEQIEGVHCVASPIFDFHGRPIASITITGPSFRMKEEVLEEIGLLMRQKTQVISKRLGYKFSTPVKTASA